MSVTRWVFEYGNPLREYRFPRNPDRSGGDNYFQYEQRNAEIDILGASLPTVQIDGVRGGTRTLRFTAITGDMMRELQKFYLRGELINNCRDHLYNTTMLQFNCVIISFSPSLHPTIGNFPGSGEDTWDLEMVLKRMS